MKDDKNNTYGKLTELEKEVEKYKVILDSSYYWEYLLDNDENFVYVSPACERITGYNANFFYKDKELFKKIIYPADNLTFLNYNKNKKNTQPIEFRIIKKNGDIVRISHFSNTVLGNKKQKIGIRSSNRFVYEEIYIESKKNILSKIVEQSPAAIVITNTDGSIEYVNSAFTEKAGYTYNEVKNKNPSVLKSDKTDKKVFTELWKTITKGKVWVGEFINKKKSGEEYYEKAIISPTFDDGKIINYFAIKEDITKQKMAELALLESEKKLKEAINTRDKIFKIIAHDLRSPFNAIIGLSNMLLEHHTKISKEKKDMFLRNILDSSKNTYSLLENLLEWAKTQTGTFDDKFECIAYNDFLDNCLGTLISIAESKNINLKIVDTKNFNFFGNKNMLQTVLRNLISNAIKFTKRNGKITISALESNGKIIISVNDDGVGISKKEQDKLFDNNQFFTTKGTNNEKGSGIGLPLCKELVVKNNGKIWVESKKGQGSTFYFSVPAFNCKKRNT